MSGPIDFERINAAALRNGRALVQQLIPGGTFRSLEYVARNPARDDKNPGSFTINYRTGLWADFAIGAKDGDMISWYAHAYNLDQSEAARQIANKLGIPLYKINEPDSGIAARSNSSGRVLSSPNDYHPKTAAHARSWERATDILPTDKQGPPRQKAEIRRHYYPSNGFPSKKVKIKLKSEPKDTWVTYYRVFRSGLPVGWQAKKPDDYTAIPYVTTALDPFDSELKADCVLWPEGEKDVDTSVRRQRF